MQSKSRKVKGFFERLKVVFFSKIENKHFILKGNFIMKDLMPTRLINFKKQTEKNPYFPLETFYAVKQS